MKQRLRPRGSNHVGMRQFNERVVLQAIRLNGSVSKADIARLTRLTPQTVQIIIARLEADALVRKLEPTRGKVGQPSVPMALNPDGAFSIGIKIGRRSLDMLLLDFTGQVRERASLSYAFPDPDTLFAEIKTRLAQLVHALPFKLRARLHGVGVAAPLSLGGWQAVLDIRPRQAAKWAQIDLRERVTAMTDLPVEFVKDTAAACVAELVAGRGRDTGSFLYVFIDTFIGGGLIIDSQLRGGLNGNAGAVGSLSLGVAHAASGVGSKAVAPPAQLLSQPGGGVRGPQRSLPARPRRRHHRRLVQPRTAARHAGGGERCAGALQLGRRGPAGCVRGHDRVRRGGDGRGVVAAVCQLRAGPGLVLEVGGLMHCSLSRMRARVGVRVAPAPAQ